MRNGYKSSVIVVCIILFFLCSSCSWYRAIQLSYEEWESNRYWSKISKFEIPPVDQLVFKVDTIFIEYPVCIRDKFNTWIVNAPERPLNDKMIKSLLTDSVKYIADLMLQPFALPYKSNRYNELFDKNVYSDTSRRYSKEESSSKYEVFDLVGDTPDYYILYLFNARYYCTAYAAMDLPRSEIGNLVRDYSTTYVPVLFPAKRPSQ